MRNKKLIALLIVVSVLVVSIVVCGATFLVRHVDAYSYYENPLIDVYDQNVVDAAAVKHNSSMFFVDEAGIKQRVEAAYPEIEVINVKRGFPDRVTINYVISEKLFQYQNGDKYYQCYSSGRIGGSSDSQMSGYFTVKLSGGTSTRTGDYFQPIGAKERTYVDAIIGFLRDKGVLDVEIGRFINFIDFRRDGYVYIRTAQGCSIEIHDKNVDFIDLFDRGYAVYKNTDLTDTEVLHSSGLIKVYPNLSDGAEDPISSVYVRPDAHYTDDGYYAQYYDRQAI